ncbi:MAG: hypothetical protein IPL65_06625 [Lewinellaceae bacterium]|nr:hypothetical protein [Lewinellaceae bacterium]
MLRSLPTGIFQLGQEDSSTKGYFTHTSTSIKRRVRLRFGLWDQYNMELHRDDKRKESLQKFFAGFEKFEESTKEQIDSLFFYVDEYIGTEIDILLRNGQRIFKQNGFGKRYIKYNFFNEILEEVNLKTGQNKG